MRKGILLFVAWFLLGPFVGSILLGADGFAFRQLPQADLLYGNSINAMLEDHDGFLWLGTSKGLYCYDGYTLRNQHDIPASGIDYNEFVTNLQEDASHHLWVSRSMASQYIVLSPDRTFVDAEAYMQGLGMGQADQYLIHIDKSGNIWRITPDTLAIYDFARSELRCHRLAGLSSASTQRLSVRAYDRMLYILEGKVLHIFDEERAVWQEEELDLLVPSLGAIADDVKLAHSYIDPAGGLWIYSLFTEDILYREAATNLWRHIALPAEARATRNYIRALAQDADGNIWIGTSHRGLFRYDMATGQMQQFRHQIGDAHSLSSNNVNKLMVDSHNTLWLGYFKTGFAYYHAHADLAQLHQGEYGDVNALWVDADGTRWIGTDGQGLWRESQDGRISRIESIPNVLVTDILRGRDGNLWVGTYDQGLYQIAVDGHVKHLCVADGQLPHDGAVHLAMDGYERLWVCSPFGPMYCLLPKTCQWQTFPDEGGNDLLGESLCYDEQRNRIILATYWGLWIQNLQTDKGTRFVGPRQGSVPLHEYHAHNVMAQTTAPLVWMTHDRGISVWDTSADSLYLLSRDQGITHTLLAMRQDVEGNVWLSSTTSLTMITPQQRADGSWDFLVRRVSTPEDGIASPFNNRSIATSAQGHMLFGTLDGYYEVGLEALQSTADSLLQAPTFAPVQLGDSILSQQDLLHLTADDHPLTFRFYTGHPLDATKVHFSYRIQRLRDEWVELSGNTLTLHTLLPGDYTIEVRAMGPDAQWSPVSTLSLHVDPYWWNTIWMRLVYAVGLLLFGCIAMHFTSRVYLRRSDS